MTPTMPNVHPDGHYNTTQAAAALGISRQTLWRLQCSGAITPRLSRRTMRAMFRGKDIINFWRSEA